MRLASMVYGVLRECRDFGLRDQMQRAAVSVPSNIAEGYERNTNMNLCIFFILQKGRAPSYGLKFIWRLTWGLLRRLLGTSCWNRQRRFQECCITL